MKPQNEKRKNYTKPKGIKPENKETDVITGKQKVKAKRRNMTTPTPNALGSGAIEAHSPIFVGNPETEEHSSMSALCFSQYFPTFSIVSSVQSPYTVSKRR